MGVETMSRREALFVAQLLRLCQKALVRSHASVSSLIGYIADDLEKEICEFPILDRTNKLRGHSSDASRPAISRSS
jgi:hypothetical protein